MFTGTQDTNGHADTCMHTQRNTPTLGHVNGHRRPQTFAHTHTHKYTSSWTHNGNRYTCTCACAHSDKHTNASVHGRSHVQTFTRTHACINICAHGHATHKQGRSDMCVPISDKHTHTHAHSDTCTHTCTHVGTHTEHMHMKHLCGQTV